MRTQTFIIILLDENGFTVNFERWSYKRLKTCIDKMVQLYKKLIYYDFTREELKKTVSVVAHKTDFDTNEDNKVWEVSINEFLKMIEIDDMENYIGGI